jgi:superfamily II DNA or RNA helicase
MGLRDIELKKSYSSEDDNILHNFYIPVLKESVQYERLAGFFSSTSLAVAARGIASLIENGGHMRLLVSPKLTSQDIKAIREAGDKPEKFIAGNMLLAVDDIEDEFLRNHVKALSWLLAQNHLEINVAIPCDENNNFISYNEAEGRGIFHPKVGILKDIFGNVITFSGSVNESALGWTENIEEFKVFRSWEESQAEYLNADIERFERLWHGKSKKVKTIPIPKAVRDHLLEIAPKDLTKKQVIKLLSEPCKKKEKVKLYDHQMDAILRWINNGMQGIFEMATGTGKTFTALGCVREAAKKHHRLVIVINCPLQHLIQQWKREIKKFDLKFDSLIIADSTQPSWKSILTDALIDISLEYKEKIIVLTTHKTFSKKDFIEIIKENKNGATYFLISDEVHWVGAQKSQKGLLKEYDLRLGLSATPKRWFDTFGTNTIYDYFHGVVFEFSLKDAISKINPATNQTYLTPYRYIPKFVNLTEEELEDYIKKTRALALKLSNSNSDEERDVYYDLLIYQRAEIIKGAVQKYEKLREILHEINEDLQWLIIYCLHAQIDEVINIISRMNIVLHRFTMEEGTTPSPEYDGLSERDYLLKKFEEGKYKILVAMKCLDEGVDIPPARKGILMSSSGNPREYIQRIGRMIRRYPGKFEAVVYDIIVAPSLKGLPDKMREFEWKIFNNELNRYEEISKIALNSAETLKKINDLRNKLMED